MRFNPKTHSTGKVYTLDPDNFSRIVKAYERMVKANELAMFYLKEISLIRTIINERPPWEVAVEGYSQVETLLNTP